ncbi:hypothetical protein M9H77_08535 [Catharanthus roseus]|uniref:Uncharacterized protein n=1 Tax=Catharanthus roseus TaxID=4058 RepID=A0ACC0BY45_CATRO|nr:hypothetical protein M9H77_08535 [Catharanthus roseus]
MLLYEIFVNYNIFTILFLIYNNGVDLSTFEEFLEPEEYVDHEHLFATDRIFNSKPESRTSDRRPYVTLGCECGGANKLKKKPVVDDEEEEVQVKRRGPYGTKKCSCPFKLKGEQIATCENWQVFVHDWRHKHAIGVYTHGHAQAAKLTEEQLIQIELFRESHLPPRNILRFFREQNVGCAVSHLAFKKIWSEITRVVGIYDDPKNKCRHYLRMSHGLPCACELITRFDHILPIQLHAINAFWKTLEIGGPHPSARQQDMNSEMRSLTDLLHQISTGLISKVREMRRLAKGVLNPVVPEDPGVTLTSPPEVAVTTGWKKTNSTKRDK